jgi:ethanolamine utilization microcompartment shell protein EutL
MSYARIAVIHLQRATDADAMIASVKPALLEMLRKQPGFVSYAMIRTSTSTVTAVTIWEAREQAEQGVLLAEQFNRDGVGSAIAAVEASFGEVIIHEHT